MDENSYKNILIYQIGYIIGKDFSFVKLNYAKLNCFIINKINGYIEENSRNKYLALVSIDDSKDTLNKNMKNYVVKSVILLDQQLITQMITMKKIYKSILIQMMIYL